MASIGGSTVTVFQGRLIAAVRRTRLDEGAVGDNGSIIVRSGWKCTPCKIHTAVEVSGTIATARTLIDAYRALLNTSTYTVVDSLGETWANVAMLEVVGVPSFTVIAGVYRVVADWVMLPVAVSA